MTKMKKIDFVFLSYKTKLYELVTIQQKAGVCRKVCYGLETSNNYKSVLFSGN